MKKKEEENIILYELRKGLDGSTIIGNSIEVSREDAIYLIKNRQAKHADYQIGVMPDFLKEKAKVTNNNDDDGAEG